MGDREASEDGINCVEVGGRKSCLFMQSDHETRISVTGLVEIICNRYCTESSSTLAIRQLSYPLSFRRSAHFVVTQF